MPSEITDALIVLIRWLHAMAAVVWIGGAFSFLVIPTDAFKGESTIVEAAERGYREITDLAVPVFILTGAILTFDRFARGVAGPAYIGVLVAKVVLAFGMFHLAYRSRRAGLSVSPTTVRSLCVAGATIVLMATVLKSLNGS